MKNSIEIVRLSKPQHKFIAIAAVIILVQAVLQQATPITLKFVVDELALQITTGNGAIDRLVLLFTILLIIQISSSIITAVGNRLGDYISSRLGRYLTELYYQKVFTLPQAYFDSEISGKMVNQLNRGIASIQNFVKSTTNFILPALLQAVFGIGVLAYFDWKIALLAASVFPVYIAISTYSTQRWGKIQEKKNVHEDASRGRIQEAIGNIKLVKTYNTQQHEWGFVSSEYQKINKLYDKQSIEYHILNFFREFGLEIMFILILFIVFRNTFFGSMSLGEMVLIFQILNQLRWPLYGMSYILEQVQRAEADSKAFIEVLKLKSTEVFQTKKLSVLQSQPVIKFEAVDFAYTNDETAPNSIDGRDKKLSENSEKKFEEKLKPEKVLKNIHITFESNETVALVGHSGAGKSTVLNLIMKLYEPTAGALYLSDKKYSEIDHAWVRDHIALVFQDNELFSSTIKENVAYGVQKATDTEIWQALKQANADTFVKKLPEGLDAKIGERGVKLSGGQKQRIQIARAILHNKPILILDEATSSLDSKSEHLVQDALEKLFKNRLVIIIAHRFSTIQNVDRIIVLDKGTIVDSGRPSELVQRDGVYSELLKYQVEGNKKLLSKYEIY